MPVDVSQIVFVAGMAFISAVISKEFFILPLFLCLIFPGDVRVASFVGMVASLPLSAVLLFTKNSR